VVGTEKKEREELEKLGVLVKRKWDHVRLSASFFHREQMAQKRTLIKIPYHHHA